MTDCSHYALCSVSSHKLCTTRLVIGALRTRRKIHPVSWISCMPLLICGRLSEHPGEVGCLVWTEIKVDFVNSVIRAH